MRERDKIKLRLIIQVDTACHKLPNFIEKAARAGVHKVFIGLENINPDNLLGAKKRQNKITDYRKMMLAWKNAGVIAYAGYILGFPNDTPESILQDIEIIKKELPLDILEFFCLTPLPGSEDHKVLWQKGVWMDPDMNKYDLEHVTTGHARMTHEQWIKVYQQAWSAYYTREHVLTIFRRAYALGGHGVSRLLTVLCVFSSAVPIEGVHPLQAGFVRLKYPAGPAARPADRAGVDVLSQVRMGAAVEARPYRRCAGWSSTACAARRARNTRSALYGPGHDAGCRRRDRDARNVHAQAAARNQVAHVRKVAELTSGKAARRRIRPSITAVARMAKRIRVDRPAFAASGRARERAGSARDDHLRADADAGVEVEHVAVVHADAAVGHEAADRARLRWCRGSRIRRRSASSPRRPSDCAASRLR